MGGTPFGALVGGVLADAFDVLVAFAVAAVGVGTSAVAAWFMPLREAAAVEEPAVAPAS